MLGLKESNDIAPGDGERGTLPCDIDAIFFGHIHTYIRNIHVFPCITHISDCKEIDNQLNQ